MLDLSLTAQCPLRCRYCSVKKIPYPELTAKKWIEIISSFARLRPIGLISLEGGEPFLRQDLAEILAACLDFAGRVKIVTSGVLSFNRIPEKLLRHPRFFLEVSMDGPQEVQDFLRDGSWSRARDFLRSGLEGGIQMRLRSVVSRYNLAVFESWLAGLDLTLAPFEQKVGFSFDPLIAPESLAGEGGDFPRLGLSSYPTRGLIPSPPEIWRLYWNLKGRSFKALEFIQNEPLRGCGAAKGGVISFDPAGIFSFCCEAPNGMGWIRNHSAEQCLALLEICLQKRPCQSCIYFIRDLCRGCVTGQKCGLIGYWGAENCRALYDSMVLPHFPESKVIQALSSP